MTRDQDRYFQRQIAIRRLLLGPDGKLTRDGKILALWMQRKCFAGRGADQKLIQHDNAGRIDETSTVARAARRELWDDLVSLLNLDYYSITNLTED